MSRKISQRASGQTKQSEDAVTEYVAALEKIYPEAKGKARVTRREDRIMVNIPLPTKDRELMHLFDRMAEVGTRLLLETDEYIILSSR